MIEFQEALKNSRAYNLIKADIDKGNLSNAYMIISPDGYTMKGFFTLLACAVYCPHDACLDCTVCNRIIHGNHADVKFINEAEKNIGVKDIEELIEDTATKPYESDNKLYFIYAADKMNAQSQNKLLKTLEEPQKAVTIFLSVQKESAMLDTVKSRSKKIYLDRFQADVIEAEMLKISGNPENAAIAAACSDGMLGRAKEICTSGSYSDMYDSALTILRKMQKSGDIATFLNSKVLNKDNLPAFLDVLSIIVRDMMAVKSNDNLIFSKHKIDDIVALAGDFSERALAGILYLVNEERKKINFYVGNAGIAENLLFGILEVKYKCQ